jgi:hypothetical protein
MRRHHKMTSPFNESDQPGSIRNIGSFVVGIIALLFAAVLYFALQSLDFNIDENTNGIIDLASIVLPLLLALSGLAAIALSFYASMDQYYVRGGYCTLTTRMTCPGGCTKCVFALAYIQGELEKEKTASEPIHKEPNHPTYTATPPREE